MTKQQILDTVVTLGDVTHGYYPTEDEFNEETEDCDIEDFVYLILYLSTDPFTRLGLDKKDDKEYQSMVEYAKGLADEIPGDQDFKIKAD